MPTELADQHALPASGMDACDGIGMDPCGVGDSSPISCHHELGAVRETYFELAEYVDTKPVAGIDGQPFRQETFVGPDGETAYAKTAQTWQMV